MSRFRLREPAAHAHGDGAEAEPGGAEELLSPGLRAALAGPSARPGCRVLDFGPLLPANFNFLSRFVSHVGIADLSGEEDGGAGAMPKGPEPRRPISARADVHVGAAYALFVPDAYDPAVPWPLLIGLHGAMNSGGLWISSGRGTH